MDRKELAKQLLPFLSACKRAGYPLQEVRLEEAFPGVASTSFDVKIWAEWLAELGSSSKALDILIDILWETVEPETRRYIFALHLYDTQEKLHRLSREVHSEDFAQIAA